MRIALPARISQPQARPSAARPWMAADGAEGGFALKVGLGRLLPCEALRDQIERTAEALQALALRGSLVATTVVLEELRQERPCPRINTATWWRTCVTSCGRLERRQLTSSSPTILATANRLFSGHAVVYYDFMWTFISSLVREMLVACQRMVATTFSRRLLLGRVPRRLPSDHGRAAESQAPALPAALALQPVLAAGQGH